MSEELLRDVIITVNTHGYVPREGKVVVKLYKEGELQDSETNLYVIAELLTRLYNLRDEASHRGIEKDLNT